MASVTLDLGAPTHSTAAWVQWDNRSSPDALGDISVLSADSFARKLVRIRIFNSGSIQLQTIRVPDGTSGFATRDELSEAWESSLVAIKLRRLNGTTLQLGGPNSSVATSKDSTEPYAWSLTGATQLTAIRAFFSTYSTNLFVGAATVVLDDGVTAGVEHAVDAGDVSFSFQVSQPAITAIYSRLGISQFRQSGLRTPVVLALIEATITNLGVGTQITRDPAVPIAGSLVISSRGFTSATIGRVLRHNANMNIQLLKTTSGAFWQFFNTGGAYQYAKLYIQTADAVVPFVSVNHGGGFSNWRIADSTQWHVITGIQTGDRFLLAIAVPGALRAVDAGDISFSFSIAQPRVTLSPLHTVNPGDVSFEFRTAVSGVTRTLARRHAVDAGGVSFEFRTTIPSVTRSQPERRSVNPGDVSFSFSIAQPTVTKTPAANHAVNPGDVSFSFQVSRPAVSYSDATALSTRQFDQSGLKAPIVLALLEAAVAGVDITVSPVQAIGAGDLVVSSPGITTLTIIQIERYPDGTIRLRRSGGLFSSFFNSSNVYGNAKLYIQTADAVVPFVSVNHGGGFSNWRPEDASQFSVISGLQTGDRFLFAIAQPVVSLAVNAGDVSFSFSIAQPQITLTAFVPPVQDHAIDAGDVSFSFSIAQPTVTRSQPERHAVGAGDVSFIFRISQPAVSTSSPKNHAVNAGDVSFSFRVRRPRVTKSQLLLSTISTRSRPIPSNNRHAYQVSPNRAVPQLALTPDIFISIPGKTASLGERIFPFSGLVINSNTPISGARWRRDSGAWTDIIVGDFTDIVSATRFYSEILNEYGEFNYDLDIALGRVSITVQSKILLGLPKTTDVDVRYKPFSDAHIATDKTQIRSIKYSAKGDDTINKTTIKRPVLYSGEHDGLDNSLYLVNSGMDFNGLNIRPGQDILKNVASSRESVIKSITTTRLGTRGNIEWDSGDSYEILDGASLDIIARGFELSHSSSGLYILTLHVEDRSAYSNESSASVSVLVD